METRKRQQYLFYYLQSPAVTRICRRNFAVHQFYPSQIIIGHIIVCDNDMYIFTILHIKCPELSYLISSLIRLPVTLQFILSHVVSYLTRILLQSISNTQYDSKANSDANGSPLVKILILLIRIHTMFVTIYYVKLVILQNI